MEVTLECGDEPHWVPPNPMPYITDWLFEIGPDKGDGPLEWADLIAWQGFSGIELTPLEARLLRRLSIAHVNQKHKAFKEDCPMPHSDREAIAERRDAVANKIARIFG